MLCITYAHMQKYANAYMHVFLHSPIDNIQLEYKESIRNTYKYILRNSCEKLLFVQFELQLVNTVLVLPLQQSLPVDVCLCLTVGFRH